MLAIVPQVAILDVASASCTSRQEGRRDTLMRGFTSVRDPGGPVFGLKRAIDTGLVPGRASGPRRLHLAKRRPRRFPAAHRDPGAAGPDYSYAERIGAAVIVDSPDAVRLRTREQLHRVPAPIKLLPDGGTAISFGPLDVTQ